MKVVEITISKGRKINTGNYESRDYFVAVKIDPFDFDPQNYGVVIQDYFSKIEQDIQKEIQADRLRDQGLK